MSDDATFTLLLAKQDFKFSCAHFLIFDAERAELLHGHNYHVRVEMRGRSLNEEGLLADMAGAKRVIRAACARLDNRTLVPLKSHHLTIERRGGSVELTFGERSYRFPEADLFLLDEANTSIEVLSRMLWRELAEELDSPRIEELAVSVSQTAGQECWYRGPLRRPAS